MYLKSKGQGRDLKNKKNSSEQQRWGGIGMLTNIRNSVRASKHFTLRDWRAVTMVRGSEGLM